MPEPEPYEQQPGETRPAYEAFCVYRDTPPGEPRSLRKVGQKLGKSGSLISRWSSVWSWPDRAASWDTLIEAQAQDSKRAEAVVLLLDYQRRMGERARSLNIITEGLMKVAGDDIIRRANTPEALSDSGLAALCRAIGSLADQAAGLEAISLGVPQLVTLFHETHDA